MKLLKEIVRNSWKKADKVKLGLILALVTINWITSYWLQNTIRPSMAYWHARISNAFWANYSFWMTLFFFMIGLVIIALICKKKKKNLCKKCKEIDQQKEQSIKLGDGSQ